MSNSSHRRSSGVAFWASALALVALGVTAALAFAAHPIAGAQYKGKETGNSGINAKISFKVNDGGTKVRELATDQDAVFNFPSCSPSPDVRQTSEPTNISSKGKFKGTIHYTYSNGATGTAVVKGKFDSDGTEHGKLTGTFPSNPDCNGAASYSTKAR